MALRKKKKREYGGDGGRFKPTHGTWICRVSQLTTNNVQGILHYSQVRGRQPFLLFCRSSFEDEPVRMYAALSIRSSRHPRNAKKKHYTCFFPIKPPFSTMAHTLTMHTTNRMAHSAYNIVLQQSMFCFLAWVPL